MTQTVEQILEFPQALALLRRYVQSPLGMAELDQARPLADRAEAERQLAEVEEAIQQLRGAASGGAGRLPVIDFHGLHAVQEAATRLEIEGAALELLEILHLLELMERAGQIRANLEVSQARFPLLAEVAGRIGEFRPLLRELAGKILPNGQLDDHASSALRRLRREIQHQKRAVQDSLERFLRAHSEEGSLQEEYVTIRNERLVVPVKVGQKRRIEGVIHGASSTGHTLFVEPLEAIELNNQLVRLAEEEAREIERIRREMTERLAHYRDSIGAAVQALGRLDFVFARGRFSRDFGATVPRFSPAEKPRVELRQARHPLLEAMWRERGEPGRVVPASLALDQQRRVLIISGPNTGGKTVTLKTVGLLALMAQAGLPVTAEEAEFPWFDQVLADIGDYQSIQESLSTFSAHITAVRRMVEQASAGSLVLLDEMGAATDPQEGGALAVAVADHFRGVGAFTVVATHLPALKIYGAHSAGVLSASMGFHEETLEPNYRLSVGLPGKSAGLDIARRLGIPGAIIERAQQALSSQDQEAAALLRELHRRAEESREAEASLAESSRQLARREKEIEREWEKRETTKLKELERRVEAALARFSEQAREAIENIARLAGGRKAASEAARQPAKLERELREEFRATVLETFDQAQQGTLGEAAARLARRAEEGSMVRLKGVTAPGRVRRRLGDGKLEVEIGLIKMQVGTEEVLEVLAGAPAATRLPEQVRFQAAPRREPSLSEINVIGATAEEARDRVDKFLDTAVLASLARVRVVHGHGMGVLRKALWSMFATHVHVEKYYQAEQQEGGAGATIVELKI